MLHLFAASLQMLAVLKDALLEAGVKLKGEEATA
jgi:hypothetical protein